MATLLESYGDCFRKYATFRGRSAREHATPRRSGLAGRERFADQLAQRFFAVQDVEVESDLHSREE